MDVNPVETNRANATVEDTVKPMSYAEKYQLSLDIYKLTGKNSFHSRNNYHLH